MTRKIDELFEQQEELKEDLEKALSKVDAIEESLNVLEIEIMVLKRQ
tara:strand:- start:497 stop:637 length:141 start_codon:yes stop_codon:yes gene_type:complete